jgi:hypothetical protein
MIFLIPDSGLSVKSQQKHPNKKTLKNLICLCYSTVRGWLPEHLRLRTKKELREMYKVLNELTGWDLTNLRE